MILASLIAACASIIVAWMTTRTRRTAKKMINENGEQHGAVVAALTALNTNVDLMREDVQGVQKDVSGLKTVTSGLRRDVDALRKVSK